MPIQVTMPRLSDTMEQGTVMKWNVKEGQKVKSGDVIADIETDKATMELQSFDDGTVAQLTVPEGQSVKVGTVIMLIATADESVDEAKKGGSAAAAAAPAKKESGETKRAAQQGGGSSDRGSAGTAVMEPPGRRAESTMPSPAAPSAPASSPTPEPKGRIFASPLARKIAEESGVDLNHVEGTGPSGRIIRKDVEAAASNGGAPAGRAGGQPTSRPPSPQRVPTAATVPGPAFDSDIPRLEARMVQLSNMRRVIAKRLVESKTTIPHYQVTVEVDMDPLLDLRARLNEQLASQGVKLSVNDFLVRACALAMHQHPFVNSRWVEQNGEVGIQILGDVNIGVAIALPIERGGGLVVGTLRSADRMGLRQISAETKRLADKARAKGLSPEEMADSTYTISNLGMFGVDHFTAIINPPNAAILAVGAALEKAVVKDGKVVPGHRMSMTQSSDHRIVDGAMAAQYLATVKTTLERPATLLV